MPAAGAYLPNLVIAGVTKAGTTSLFAYLGQHPDICPAAVKEIDHFVPLVYGEEPPDLAAYRDHFAACNGEPWRLEASPRYFIGGRDLAIRLQKDLPDPRIVMTLRDPVTRLWSSYTFKKSRGRLPSELAFGEYFDRCRAVYDQQVVRDADSVLYRALSVGRYSDYLGDWLDVFGDRLRVVFFEHLAAAPAGEVAGIYQWLGLSTDPVASMDFGVRNPTLQPRSLAVRRLAYRAGPAVKRMLGTNSPVVRRLKSSYRKVNAKSVQEQLSDADRQRVADFYRPALTPLRTLLADNGYQRLPEWLDA